MFVWPWTLQVCLKAKYLNGIFCIDKVQTSKLCLSAAAADESLLPEAGGENAGRALFSGVSDSLGVSGGIKKRELWSQQVKKPPSSPFDLGK